VFLTRSTHDHLFMGGAVRVEMIATNVLGEKRLSSIIALKSQHWPYPIESQIKWFGQNVLATDKHVLGWKGDVLVGYLRMVPADGMQERKAVQLAIIDTVCIARDHHRQSLGLELMTAANHAIQLASRVGLLACAPDLLPFYKRCNWTLFPSPVQAAAEMRALLPEGNVLLIYDPALRLGQAPLQVSARIGIG